MVWTKNCKISPRKKTVGCGYLTKGKLFPLWNFSSHLFSFSQLAYVLNTTVRVCLRFLVMAERAFASRLLSVTPQTCKPCSCPASTKKPRDSDRDLSALLEREILRPRSKGVGSKAWPCAATWQHSSLFQGQETTIYREVDVRLLQLTGRPAAGQCPAQSPRLVATVEGANSEPTGEATVASGLEQSLAGAGSKHTGSCWLSFVFKRIGQSCEWSRDWFSRAHTESKRTPS